MGWEVLEFEVDADGGEVALCEFVVGESMEQGGFAHGGVADDDDFEQVVVLSDHGL